MSQPSPYYEAYRQIRLPVRWRRFWRLPRHPSYKYEFFDGRGLLSPRPNTVDMALDLAKWAGPPSPTEADITSPHTVRIRRVTEADWHAVTDAFEVAFRSEEPFRTLSKARARATAKACLDHTRRGGDGELIHDACFLAEDTSPTAPRLIVGATIITRADRMAVAGRMPDGAPPPEDLPHLTWIFVARHRVRRGIGTFLLDRVVRALRDAGHAWLISTAVLGNTASLLWHWRNRFTLLASGFSVRVGVADESLARDSAGGRA